MASPQWTPSPQAHNGRDSYSASASVNGSVQHLRSLESSSISGREMNLRLVSKGVDAAAGVWVGTQTLLFKEGLAVELVLCVKQHKVVKHLAITMASFEISPFFRVHKAERG